MTNLALSHTDSYTNNMAHIIQNKMMKKRMLKRLSSEQIASAIVRRESNIYSALKINSNRAIDLTNSIQSKKVELAKIVAMMRPQFTRLSGSRSKSLYASLVDDQPIAFHDDVNSILQVLSSNQSDYEDSGSTDYLKRYLILNYILSRKELSIGIADKAKRYINWLEKNYSTEIFSSINASEAFDKSIGRSTGINENNLENNNIYKQKVSKKNIVQMHSKLIAGYESLNDVLNSLRDKFNYENIVIGINAMIHALGYDLNCSRSSASPIRINSVMNDIKKLRCVAYVVERIRDLQSRFNTLKIKNLPKQEDHFNLCLNILNGQHMIEPLIKSARSLRPSLKESIVFTQESAEILRQMPFDVWLDDDSRAVILQTIALECFKMYAENDYR